MNRFEQKVYPFTTEDIASYIKLLNVWNKSVLTVGSSCDQAFNALVCGAKDVTIIDINPNTKKFLEIKKDIILNSSLEELYYKVLKDNRISYSDDLFTNHQLTEMNNYMSSKDKYSLLQDRLKDNDIKVIEGNIFNFSESVKDSYDRIILSNILQYIPMYINGTDYSYESFIKTNFLDWISHLNKDGIIQLLYLYNLDTSNKELFYFVNALQGYLLYKEEFRNLCNSNAESAIITYEKRK